MGLEKWAWGLAVVLSGPLERLQVQGLQCSFSLGMFWQEEAQATLSSHTGH